VNLLPWLVPVVVVGSIILPAMIRILEDRRIRLNECRLPAHHPLRALKFDLGPRATPTPCR
jgi:hypothetical protein